MLRRMAVWQTGRAAARRFIAVAGHARAVEWTQLIPSRAGCANIEGDWDDRCDDTCARPNPRGGCLFFASRPTWVRRSCGACRSNGARACGRAKMADQGTDARSDRNLPILAGTARHPSRHLCLIPAYRILGCLGRRLGLYLPEFCDCRGAWCALCLSRRSAAGERDVLWREPRRDRPHPAILLSAGTNRNGRLAVMGTLRR